MVREVDFIKLLQSHIKALQYAFRDRKNKKRSFRNLWIARINAVVSEQGTSYSRFIANLKRTY